MINNLRYIIAIRNEIEHRSYEDINAEIQSKIQAAALNFLRYAKEKFGPSSTSRTISLSRSNCRR